MSSIKYNKNKKLPVKHVKSVGAVILDPDKRVLIMFQNQNKYWEIPKGKVESGEEADDFTTLKREIFEETGLQGKDLQIIKGFKFNLRYQFRLKGELIKKSNIFYLARTKKTDIILSDEHEDYKWISLAAVNRYFKHKGQRILIYKLREFLNESKLENSQ